MTDRKHTPIESSDQDQELDEPNESELTEAQPELSEDQPVRAEVESATTTALVPKTSLQQYLTEVRRYPYLSKEEELQLFHEYQTQGNREAAVKLILANLRVSVAVASEYFHTGFDQLDLIQEGNVGLMQAIKKFDVTKNVRFYAYAAWWARAYILRYLLNNFRLVKIGTTQDQRKLFYNLRKEKAKLEREGYTPDAKLLADRLQVRERDVIEMDQRLGNWELSLDQPLTQESDGTLLDVLPSHEVGIDERLAADQLRSLFRKKLAEFAKTLDEREEDILRNRLLSDTPLTLEDLGGKYRITKERTRQLEARLIKRLREFMKKDIRDFDRLRT
ncbi:RNA polymerase sigma factor [Nitrospira sp.]|nr:RNA polymerase sigma factor [Nitrospira sp.]